MKIDVYNDTILDCILFEELFKKKYDFWVLI